MLEYVGPEKRTMVANVPLAVFLTLGAVTLPWIACTIGNWRTYSIVTSAPLALIVIAWWIVPESARWMVLRGKIEETIKTLKHCARVNHRTVNDAVYDEFKVTFSHTKSTIQFACGYDVVYVNYSSELRIWNNELKRH